MAFDCCDAGQTLTGSHDTGYQCCPSGQIYNGIQCADSPKPSPVTDANVCKIRGVGPDGGTCTIEIRCGDGKMPPGQPWKDGSCIKPITDCADRAHPEFGDTSYNEADFPCSDGRERPCRGEQVQPWREARLNWGGPGHTQPDPPKPFETTVNFDFDVVMSIVDIEAQSEHFLVKLDGEFLGETGGEIGYKNVYTGEYNNPEWCLLNGYTRGYFRIPKGRHTITIEWPKGTGKYLTNEGWQWGYGIAHYRFDKLCDPDKCVPDCAKAKNEEAEKARQKLKEAGKWPPKGAGQPAGPGQRAGGGEL
ncbi:hypothetical protein C8A03DRAFT_36151 [Achaetomium macrosporum]|uniref:Uncharacterized protein n=1 Tax=Achaetomium macrosporum TaxID=79813 RepID=A0AAN7C671_9PEZI|nr:hypothetical protein C8A03DRAFT_36151 [Achaetomium macrosporum]